MTCARPPCSTTRGRRPRRHLIPIAPPQLLAGPLVDRDDERGALVIPDHHDVIAVDRRRAPLAETVACRHVAEIDRPFLLSLEGVAVEARRSERRDQPLAVADGGHAGPATVRMGAFARLSFARGALPDDLARGRIQRQHGVLEHILGHVPRTRPSTPVSARRGHGSIAGDAGIGGREKEDAIAPDDWTAEPAARYRRLPRHVASLAPFDRRVGAGGDTRAIGAAPLRPVFCCLFLGRLTGRRHQGQCERGQ